MSLRFEPYVSKMMGHNEHLFTHDEIVDAPKLPRSGCSRLFGVLACTVALMCLWSFVIAIGLPVSKSSRTQDAVPSLKTHKPLPSVLKRFLNLQRSALPSHGVTPSSLAAAFPSWKTKSGDVDLDSFVRDVSLAVSLIAERLPGNTYHTPRQHSTHVENPSSEEDAEA